MANAYTGCQRHKDVLNAIPSDSWVEGPSISAECGVKDINPYLLGLYRRGLILRLRGKSNRYRYTRLEAPTPPQDDAS